MRDLKQMLKYIKTKIKSYTNRFKEWIKNLIDRFLASNFLVFTLGLTNGITYTYIYLTAPVIFQPLTKTIVFNREASAEVATGKGGAVSASPLAKAPSSSQESIVGLVARYFGKDADKAVRIMQCESQGNPTKIGDKDKIFYKGDKIYGDSIGLFQVRMLPDRKFTRQELKDPETNIKEAYRIYQSQGWEAWHNCNLRTK